MVDFIRGIKAGIAAGIVYGIVYIVFQIFFLLIYWQSYDILATDMMAVIAFYFPLMIIGGIIAGIILGIIFGLIFAAVYNSIPGSTPVGKAALLSLIGWLIFNLSIGYGNVQIDPTIYVVNNVIFGLINWLIWAAIFGKMWGSQGIPASTQMQQPMVQQHIYQQPVYQQPSPVQQPNYQPPPQQTPPPSQYQQQPQAVQQPPIQQQQQQPQQETPTSSPKFCSQCGAKLAPNTKFCSQCGNKL